MNCYYYLLYPYILEKVTYMLLPYVQCFYDNVCEFCSIISGMQTNNFHIT